MMTEYTNDAEGISCDDKDEEIGEIVLKVTPVLTFASGPWSALRVQVDNNSFEMQKSVHVETITRSGHNHKQTNTSDSDNNLATSKAEKPGKTTNIKLDTDGCPESNTNSQTVVSPESPSQSRRSHKMALKKSLSSSAAEEKEVSVPPRPTRRLSDSTVPCQKSLVKGTFDRQAPCIKKLRPYLKRKAVSPLHLLGKVASSTGSKHNHDVGPFKDSKAGNKARLGKRLYPSFSQKACEQMTHGSDPSVAPSEDVCRSVSTVNGYETMINDYSSQIEGLAVNLEKLSAGDTANQEFQENSLSSGSHRQYRQQCGEPEAREDNNNNNNTENFLREDDIHLQEMLEDVLRSHLLSMEDYSLPSCDRASRSICKIITRLLSGAVKRTGDGQRKLACVVYIGAVRDNGIQMAAQALWCPDEDTFAAASFRNESVYGLAVVITIPI